MVRKLGLEYIAWAKQAASEAAAWVRSKSKHESNGLAEKEIAGFQEGYKQGYLKAIADLRMHGFLSPA